MNHWLNLNEAWSKEMLYATMKRITVKEVMFILL